MCKWTKFKTKQEIKKLLLILICFLLSCNICKAENELANKSRKVKQSDLIGTWSMIYQTVSPLFRDNSQFFADYQTFEFFEDGYVKNITSNKRLERRKINSLLRNMPKGSVYKFIDEGLLIIERSEQDFDNLEVYIAVDDFKIILRPNAPLLRKGDLIVSYFDGKKNLYMQRYLRRASSSSN